MTRALIAILLSAPLFVGAMTARSYAVTDMSGNVIVSKDPDVSRPIASITKLITTSRNLGLPDDELITITEADVRNGRMRTTPLRVGQSYSRRVLIDLALVNSDNVAAIALGRTTPIPASVPKHTTYVEASGLDPDNRSTARELTEIARSLYSTELAVRSVQPYVSIGGTVRKNTNPLIGAPGWTFYLTKTGFINPSGGCLVVITKIKDQIVAVAILGSVDTRQRWRDLAEIREKLGDSGFMKPFSKPVKAVKVKQRRRR